MKQTDYTLDKVFVFVAFDVGLLPLMAMHLNILQMSSALHKVINNPFVLALG